jgi:hypothetical protein
MYSSYGRLSSCQAPLPLSTCLSGIRRLTAHVGFPDGMKTTEKKKKKSWEKKA